MKQADRTAWLAERRQGLGGSDIAAILGLSPWKTPVDLYLDKTGQAPEQEETDAMAIGTELEDYVARRYAREQGVEVRRHNKMIHQDCLLANVDRLVVPAGSKTAAHMGEVTTNKLLECKTSSHDWESGVPLYYQVQVQHYMGLLPTIESADVACLFLIHKHFETHTIERDDEVIRELQTQARAWWQRHIVRGEVPPPTCEADCKALWARSNPGKTIEATAETIAKLADYKAAVAESKAADDRAKVLRADIMANFGDAEVLVDAAGKPLATWKSPKASSRTDWEAVARAAGASDELIVCNTTTTQAARRFLVK